MNKIKLTIILMLFAALCTAAYGQVTIGSNVPPNRGALLDIKEFDPNDPNDPKTDNITATKGLLLPRVNLTNPTDITTDITGVTAADKDAHIGLTVYNLTQCDGKFARGVYTWTGTEWVQLTNNPILTGGSPILTFSPVLPADNTIKIPSGQDLRTLAAYAPTITFAGTN